jgi:hypothetical protein
MIGSVIIDLAQVAGVVIGVVGLAVPRMKTVPNSVSIHVGPGALWGTF